MALANSLTINSQTFERLDSGLWINAATTTDEPQYLRVQSTIDPEKGSSYLMRYEMHKNSLVSGAPDDVLSSHIVVKGFNKRFTQAEIEFCTDIVYMLLRGLATPPATGGGNIVRIARGEK